ncbi:MAG: carbohydrate ABC transporter permease, partial [Dehalococcoidia bacterium]
MSMSARAMVGRIGFYTFVAVVTTFFALPMLWLVVTPFDRTPALTPSLPEFTLDNFRTLLE